MFLITNKRKNVLELVLLNILKYVNIADENFLVIQRMNHKN